MYLKLMQNLKSLFIIRQNCPNNKYEALKKLRKVYNKTSLIECKLMRVLNEIIDTVLYFRK